MNNDFRTSFDPVIKIIISCTVWTHLFISGPKSCPTISSLVFPGFCFLVGGIDKLI